MLTAGDSPRLFLLGASLQPVRWQNEPLPCDHKRRMQRHRFYAAPSDIGNSLITLEGDQAHHLSRVLRLGPGAHVFVFDGQGAEFEGEVASVGRASAEVRILSRLENVVESPLRLTLGQALVKGDKFDWIIQKTAELGVTRIVPLATEHSDVLLREGRAEHRLQRWRRIALEAVRQCGRRRLVEIVEPKSFAEFCEVDNDELKLIFSEQGGRSLREVTAEFKAPVRAVTLAIGPEGGWHQGESTLAGCHDFIPVHLGARILRTETAAIAAVTLAQHLFGDLK